MPSTPPILLISDNGAQSAALRSLTAAGYPVITASVVESALALARQHNPGLILLGDISDDDGSSPQLQQLVAHQTSNAARAGMASSLELLVNNLPGMAYRCHNDRDWTMLFVSAGAEELTGYTAEELTGGQRQKFAVLVHPDDRQQVWDNVQAALAMGQAYRLLYRITTRHGLIKWVWEQGFPSRDDSDGGLVLDGFISDISQQKWYEEELVKLHREQAVILDSTSEGIYGIDTRGHCHFINRAGARMLGYNPEELIGADIHALIHPDCTAQHCALCIPSPPSSVSPNDSRRASEDYFKHHDGTTFPVSWNLQPLHSAGVTGGAVVTFSDISERKQQQDQIRFNEERFRYIVQATHDAIWDINLASGDTWWNDGIQQLLGLTPTSSNSETQSLWINGIHPPRSSRPGCEPAEQALPARGTGKKIRMLLDSSN